MYDVDDAVAKIDGYIISIAGASPYVGEKRMVRIDQVGRTAASALLLDESGEVLAAPTRAVGARTGSRSRRRPAAGSRAAGAGGGAEEPEARGGRSRAPVDSEDTEARREAGLSDSPTAIDSEPDEHSAVSALETADAPQDEVAEDGLQSKPRRRGRRGGRRRSAAKAKATPE